MTPIKLERIVPLATPDAEVCVDGVCEIPVVEAVDTTGSISGRESAR